MSGRARILLVVKHLRQGGTERQVLRLFQAIDRTRFEPALCTLTPGLDFDRPAPTETHFRLEEGEGSLQARFDATLASFQPDVVHSFRDCVNRFVWRALRHRPEGPAWLMSVRGQPILPWDLVATRWMTPRAHAITVNSEGIAAVLTRRGGIDRARLRLTPNLIDEEAFSPVAPLEKVQARLAWGLDPASFVWLLPGRLSWVKNQVGLLFALARLQRRGELPPKTVLVLSGRVRDRAATFLVRRLVATLGLQQVVHIVGAQRNAGALYAMADALVLPSWGEGMPNAVLEAQLSGLPVVVSAGANQDRLVTEGASGHCVPTGSVSALSAAMASIMNASPGARRAMGERGRADVLARFASPKITAGINDLYDEVLAARLPHSPPRPLLTRAA